MISPSSLFIWLLQCTLLLLGNEVNAQNIRGVPGIDYPNYDTIPQTSFRCSEQLEIPGFYADPETGCQMFHHCYEHRHESFLCPPGTIFNQAILACDYWYSADCSTSTLHFGANSPQKVTNVDPEIEFFPMTNPSVNVFDKMASLYEVERTMPIDTKYESDGYNFEKNSHVSDGDVLGENIHMIENQQYADSYLEVRNHHDRREGVLVESSDEHGYFKSAKSNNENHLRMFEDSFEGSDESSGEPEDIDDHVFTEDDLRLSRNNQEENDDFERQYFTINENSHMEYEEQHNGHVNNEEELIGSNTELSSGEFSSLKGDHVPGDKFVRRQSENIETRNGKRNKRRPIFTIIEPGAEIKHFTTTEKPKDEIKISSNDAVSNYPTSTFSEEVITESKSLHTPTPSRTKRRKPILVDLEDSMQYNVDNRQNVAGDGRTSISYEENPESKLPEFSIDAEEISVKLLPSKVGRKRKPVQTYLLDPFEHHNVGSERNIESSSLNSPSPALNIYDTSTLSTLEDIDKFEDVSMSFGQFLPKRKKNIIHIIDTEDYHNVYTDNEEHADITTSSTELDNEITAHSFSEDFKGFDTFSESSIDYHNVEKELDIENDSSESGTENSYNYISPYTHIELSDESGGTYFTQINPEVAFDNEYESESSFEDEANSATPKNLEDIEGNSHDEIRNPSYLTTEFSISDISTQMPIEIQYAEGTTSRIYFISNSIVQSFDNLGNSENIPHLVPETLDENQVGESHEMGDLEFNSSHQTTTESISHELLEDSMVRDAFMEHDHSEEDFINSIEQIPDNTNESDIEIQSPQNPVFEESYYLNYEGEILNANTSENITNTEYANSTEEVEEFNPLLDTELHEYLSNENSNIENNLDVGLTKNIDTEPSVSFVDDSSAYNLGRQYHSFDPKFDLDIMQAHDSFQDEEESIHQTIQTKLESDYDVKLSDDPIKTDVLERNELGNNENKSGEEFDEMSDTEDFSNDFKGSRTDSSNAFVSNPVTTSDFASFDTKNIPSYLQTDHSFNLNPIFNSKPILGDASKSNIGNTVSSSKENTLSKQHSILERNIPGSIKTNTKDRPVKRPRSLVSPYQMGFNLESFGSRDFASSPLSMLKLKQMSMAKFFPYSMYGHGSEGMAYSTRTGNLLESPKISKLISMGKNLLRAKKAKFRILGKYVNSFQTGQ